MFLVAVTHTVINVSFKTTLLKQSERAAGDAEAGLRRERHDHWKLLS